MQRADRRRGRGRGRDRRAPARPRRRAMARARSAPAEPGSAASRSLASASAAARSPLISSGAFASGRAGRAARAWRSRPQAIAIGLSPPIAHRPPGPQRGDRPPDRPQSLKPRSRRSAAHGPTAAPSRGTARARRAPRDARASSGDAHIWSSRRPRSFLRPVGRAIAPPGEAALGRGDERRPMSIQSCACCSRVSASTSIGVWLTTSSSALWLQTSHSSGATLKSPTIKVGSLQAFRPARHPLDEVELLAELGVDRRGRACRRRPGHRHSRAGSRTRAGRRRAAPRHCPASRACRGRCSGTRLRIATPWCIRWPFSCWWT